MRFAYLERSSDMVGEVVEVGGRRQLGCDEFKRRELAEGPESVPKRQDRSRP